jgi:nicotinamidase-related amidase
MALPPEVEEQIDPTRSLLVVIDMQRRHLDPEVGYHLLDPRTIPRVVAAAEKALGAARAHRVPVVHVATCSRGPVSWGAVERANPFFAYQTGKPIPGLGRPRQSGRNVEGSVYAEILPEVAPRQGEPVVVKRRYSAFYGTDLELLVRGLRTETVFLLGVNTNNCVLATAYDAFSRDLRVVVLADACGSMNGEEYHQFALRQVEAALGFVMTTGEFADLLARRGPRVSA